MKAKRTEHSSGLLKRNGLHRWTIVLGVGLAALSGTLFPAPTQAAARVSLTLRGQWPGSASDVAVSDNYAYVAGSRQEGTNWIPGLQVIDVSSPASPVRAGGFDTSGDARRVQVVGTLAYVADGEAGLQILDVSNPASPVALGKSQTPASDVEVVGTLAYAPHYFFDGLLHILDVSNPASPVEIGGFDLWIGTVHTEPYSVQVVGTLAYVTYGSAGLLHILDVSDPASPLQVGEFDTSGDALGIQVVGTLAYVAETPRWTGSNHVGGGLEVVDVRNPANPVRVGGYDTSGDARDVAVVGDLIYLADDQQGLFILEQSLAPPPPAEWFRVETDLASTPFGRAFHGMVYDSVRGVVLLHGGNPGPGSQNFADTWAWDGTRWTRLTQQGPSVLGFGFAFDSDRGVAVLHGGLGDGSPRPVLAATWEWDGAQWRQVSDGTGPGVRAAPAMAYDPVRKRVILHGGTLDIDSSRILSDTWAWDGSSWQEISNANGPSRDKHQMVFDERRQVLVLFGGLEARGSALTDTWEFDGTEWRQVATEGPPGGRELPVLAYDSVRGVTVLWGGGEWQNDGFPAHKAFDDTWEWNGEAWTEVATEGPRPPAAQGTAGAYDPRRGRLVQFAGTRGGGDLVPRQTWEYGLPPLRITGITTQGNVLEIRWTGGAPFYQLQRRSSLTTGEWQNLGAPRDQVSATVQPDGASSFFRVLGLSGNAP